MKNKRIILFTICSCLLFGCHKTDETSADIQETAQQLGDVMASVDEYGGSSGSINTAALESSSKKTFARLAPQQSENNLFSKIFLTPASAASCASSSFTCDGAGHKTHNFSNCTIGSTTFSGTTTFTWSNSSSTCQMTGTTQSITRDPNITVTGRRGATLTIQKSGTYGQKLTWASGSGATRVLNFSSDGIRRVFTLNSTTLFDYTSATTSDITVTGTDRGSRVMTGGSVRVTDNSSGVTCDYAPTNVTWGSAACNCPTSGSWSGTCSDGKSATLNITSCGTASYTLGSDTTDLSFDRCQ